MDLSNLSVAELRDLQQKIPTELKHREAREKEAILNEMRTLAESRGYTIEDLMSRDVKTKQISSVKKVKVKYRHPQDPNLEWTGRGRKPKWVEAWLASHGNIDGLLV